MQCKSCSNPISADESYDYRGQLLCEDCFMAKQRASIVGCDPLAVAAATSSRNKLGLKGAQGLTPQQRVIYEFITGQGRATAEEIMQKFSLTRVELGTQLAILRHCELVKGQQDNDTVYFVPFH